MTTGKNKKALGLTLTNSRISGRYSSIISLQMYRYSYSPLLEGCPKGGVYLERRYLRKHADIHAVAVGDYTPSCRSVARNAPTCHPSTRGEFLKTIFTPIQPKEHP
jgi:hypothetical protein